MTCCYALVTAITPQPEFIAKIIPKSLFYETEKRCVKKTIPENYVYITEMYFLGKLIPKTQFVYVIFSGWSVRAINCHELPASLPKMPRLIS